MTWFYNPEAVEPPEEDIEPSYCPICGEEFSSDEKVYKDKDGEIIGCSNCLTSVDWWECEDL